MPWFHDWAWQLWLVMPVTMVVFWGLVIWVVVVLIQPSDRSGRPASGSPEPEQILAERYARGEIDAAEYDRRLSTLRDHAPEGGLMPTEHSEHDTDLVVDGRAGSATYSDTGKAQKADRG